MGTLLDHMKSQMAEASSVQISRYQRQSQELESSVSLLKEKNTELEEQWVLIYLLLFIANINVTWTQLKKNSKVCGNTPHYYVTVTFMIWIPKLSKDCNVLTQ